MPSKTKISDIINVGGTVKSVKRVRNIIRCTKKVHKFRVRDLIHDHLRNVLVANTEVYCVTHFLDSV